MWIKVCGVTNLEIALQVAAAGVDAIGLNFYADSKRCIDVATAAEIVDALPTNVTPVGLFVNHTTEEIRELLNATGIQTIQLHGDETIEQIQTLSDCTIIRAIRPKLDQDQALARLIQPLIDAEVPIKAVLVDAHLPGAYGGTGATAAWDRLTPGHRQQDWPPMILAGGLTPDNVAEAVQLVQPWGVDVAGGVEQSPGVKDIDQVKRFVEAAQAVDCEIDR